MQRGLTKAEAARVFGVSRTSVHWWIALYQENGEDGLTPKRPGRPKCGGRLKGWQAATIVNIIKDCCPDQLKMPFALWTRETVRDLIHMKFGIRYTYSAVPQQLVPSDLCGYWVDSGRAWAITYKATRLRYCTTPIQLETSR